MRMPPWPLPPKEQHATRSAAGKDGTPRFFAEYSQLEPIHEIALDYYRRTTVRSERIRR